MNANILNFIHEQLANKPKLPVFKAGDTVTVHYKIKEGEKERIQQFQGVVIQRKGVAATESFTVRKISNGVGVERIFPVTSPYIDKIDVNKVGIVRRARIFYMRELTGKSARIAEKKNYTSAAATAEVTPA
jgi:large subunit ribosomal protein L19